jgi:hypothetical protein
MPGATREYIMVEFLFKDILGRKSFDGFFEIGRQFDGAFAYEISFGFIPRQYNGTPQDRFIIEEDQACVEIYFILKGSWAVSFDSNIKQGADSIYELPAAIRGPEDMASEGILIL